MDYDLILRDVKEMKRCCDDHKNGKYCNDMTDAEFLNKMETDFSYVVTNSKVIFDKVYLGNMDLTVFTYMINKAKDIKRNKVTNYDASVDVGQKLVDTFVKPKKNKSKKK